MAGSRKWFVYTDDKSVRYAIQLDESNTEAVNGSAGDYVNDDTDPQISIPKNIIPRTITYVSASGLVRRRIVALTPAIFANPPQSFTDPVSGDPIGIKITSGERRKLPQALDTALNDGDAT